MKIEISSRFPADKSAVLQKLQEIATLQYICAPLAKFTPTDGRARWAQGAEFRLNLRVCGINFGTHTIRVARFDKDSISTKESNKWMPVWNHTILLSDLGGGVTGYTDIVEMKAGFKTVFVWLWANVFYRHRQRKWKRLL